MVYRTCSLAKLRGTSMVDRYLKNSVSKGIVQVIKHVGFQLYRVHPDGAI